MKFKYLFYFIYIFILLLVPCYLLMDAYSSSTVSIANRVRIITSKDIGINDNYIEDNKEKEEVLNVQKNSISFDALADSLIPTINVADARYSDVLETVTGKLTSYGPDCAGCGGRVGWGQNVTGGNIYYNDATYGQLRIVAGDKKYPYGTIVRISNSKAGGPIMAIILDRGGAVGFGKATLFDLLFATEAEASSFGTSYNCTFEILRYGF